MPRYYFHVDSHSIHDDEGVELESIAAARNQSLLLLQTAFDELGQASAGGKPWVISIADESGTQLLRVELSVNDSSAQATTKRRVGQAH